MAIPQAPGSVRKDSGVVVYLPDDRCPSCGVNILDAERVEVLDWRIGRSGGITKYRCCCGYEFWRYWPRVGELDTALRKQLVGDP